ncbi:MAG: class I SAM-dependent methyltransferase [Dehalococcoidia bacterium]
MSLDIGTGDGRAVYERAQREASRFFIGLDPAPGIEYSRRAGRKPAKGGVANALFAVGSVESPPAELAGVAGELTVLFPWGTLLRAFALPDVDALRNVRRLCRDGASLEVVLSYAERDRGELARLGLPGLSQAHLEGALTRGYRDAGFRVASVETLTRDELRALPSTWAKRLAFGRPREAWRVRAVAG